MGKLKMVIDFLDVGLCLIYLVGLGIVYQTSYQYEVLIVWGGIIWSVICVRKM